MLETSNEVCFEARRIETALVQGGLQIADLHLLDVGARQRRHFGNGSGSGSSAEGSSEMKPK